MKRLGDTWVLIDVDLDELYQSTSGVSSPLKDGCQRFAWSTPWSPEIDDDRRCVGTLDDIGLE